MKAWKYLVLIGGIAGVAGFFLPFITFTSSDGQLTGAISAYRIVSGIDDVTQLIEGARPVTMTNAEVQQFATLFDHELATYRGALVGFFVPAVALALLGALAGARHKMGRIAGLLAIALGLANAGVWWLFYQVSHEQAGSPAGIGLGLHLVGIAGVLGVLAGLGALLLPDRGEYA